ncbi:MAG: hypothetical protein EA382_05540 [Spirochaetaceae bacterium]|nr:MAG: hypothetical protein EA382_05540 [Spirochaetaceae bacterium]
MSRVARNAAAILVALALLVAVGGTAAAQSALAPRVPHRVLVSRPDSLTAISDASARALIDRIDELLFTSIAARQPIVRVYTAETANSTIDIAVAEDTLRAVLSGAAVGGGPLVESSVATTATVTDVSHWLNETAELFAPLLVMVDPAVVQAGSTGAATVREQAIATVDLADRLATPYEATLWMSGLMRTDLGGSEGSASVRLTPIALDLTWFRDRSFGVTVSGWFQRNDDLRFGSADDSQIEPTVTAVLTLVGAGIEYRALGRFGASVGLSLYTGTAWVTNTSDVAIGDWDDSDDFVVYLEPGEEATFRYTTLMFRGGLTWNATDRWALRTRFMLAIHPLMLLGQEDRIPYPSDGGSAFLLYLPVGVMFRF